LRLSSTQNDLKIAALQGLIYREKHAMVRVVSVDVPVVADYHAGILNLQIRCPDPPAGAEEPGRPVNARRSMMRPLAAP
jgi:hypothetical protein